MPESPERTFGQTFNTWVQTIGIIGAACWGAYTFVYKEIMLPKSVPVNISVNLQLKKIGPKSTNATGEDLIAVELQTMATNPSPREVHLLKSAWVAQGCNIGKAGENKLFVKNAEDSLNAPLERYVGRYTASNACSHVAAGRLFGDTVLKPNESVRRTKIFYVPVDKFDQIEVNVHMPTTEQSERVALEWKLQPDGLEPVLYHVGKDGQLMEFEKNEIGAYLDRDLKKFGLQQAVSSSSLSFWQ